MDSLKSFKGYGKMDPGEDREFRRKTKTRIILIAVSIVLLIAIVAGVVISLSVNKQKSGDSSSSPQSPISASSSIKAICSVTRYPDSCFASLSSAATSNSSTISTDPAALFQLSLAVASRSIAKLSSFLPTLKIPTNDIRLQAAINDCKELLEDAVDRLNDSTAIFTSGKPGEKILSDGRISDLKTWLSTTITDQETCLDGFEGTSGGFREKLEAAMVNSTQFASNSLAIVTGIVGIMEKLHFPINRKLLGTTGRGRGVLLADKTEANVTVAKDGSGKVKSIQEAVDMVPRRSLRPFVIYVKEGEYKENVVVDKNKWNVVMVGDGMNKTIITGDKNFIDGTPTFSTATFAVTGRGFVAKDMGFKNSAGAEKHQAVALRSGSDRSVFYRCSFDGFQDTLYAHSNRQFYRESHIIGTVDFIFGDAAVVFQNCSILPRQPLPYQSNTITAQGRKDPNQNTAISIHGCTIAPFDAFLDRPTFLGRPWKNYSTAVIMKTEIGPLVDPAGWMPWVLGTVPPETIDYAEFRNTGKGANVAARVTWPGYRPAIDADEAAKFAVGSFLDGREWIAEAGVQFDDNL